MVGTVPNDREDPRDANPMYRRLPAEVVSRRRHREATGIDGEDLINRKAVFVLKPEQRLKWLTKALRQAEDGRMRPSDLFNVVSSSRFADNLPPKLGKKMGRALCEQLSLFTGKQQRFLAEQAAINTRFGGVANGSITAVTGPGPPAGRTAAVTDPDEIMARCRAFVRDKQRERGERLPGIDEQTTEPENPEAKPLLAAAAAAEAAAFPKAAANVVDAVVGITSAVPTQPQEAATAFPRVGGSCCSSSSSTSSSSSSSSVSRSLQRTCRRSHSGSCTHRKSRNDNQKSKSGGKQKQADGKKRNKTAFDRKKADKQVELKKSSRNTSKRSRAKPSSSSSTPSASRTGKRHERRQQQRQKQQSSSSSTSSEAPTFVRRRRSSRLKSKGHRRRSPSSTEPSKRRGSSRRNKSRG